MTNGPGRRGFGSGAQDDADATATVAALRHIANHPGAWVVQIREDTGLALSVVWRALAWLEKKGHVESKTARKERRYYLLWTEWDKTALPFVAADEAWAFLRHVAEHPAAENQQAIAQGIGVSVSSIQNSAKAWTDLGLIEKVNLRGGAGVGYRVRWNRDTRRSIRLLLAKLPPERSESERLRELLSLESKE